MQLVVASSVAGSSTTFRLHPDDLLALHARIGDVLSVHSGTSRALARAWPDTKTVKGRACPSCTLTSSTLTPRVTRRDRDACHQPP